MDGRPFSDTSHKPQPKRRLQGLGLGAASYMDSQHNMMHRGKTGRLPGHLLSISILGTTDTRLTVEWWCPKKSSCWLR